MAISEREFRDALGHFTSGVTIVSTAHEGKMYGMTVASFASLSLDPPLILICLEQRVQCHDVIPRSGHFAVNILSMAQQELSNRFASRLEDRFEGLELAEGVLGDPLLAGAVAQLECRVHSILAGGDHSIFVGEVVAATVGDAEPLVYFRSGYRELKDA